MGGYGSGRWGYGGKSDAKTLVESCRDPDINRLVRAGVVRPGGSYRGGWQWTGHDGEVRASIGLEARAEAESGTLHLRYSVTRSGEESGKTLDYPVALVTTALPSGGRRWWFVCPASRGKGPPCRRRVGKLYLPPGGRVFACRHGYDLTYESSRESRKWDGLWRKLAGELGHDPRWMKRFMEREFRAEGRERDRARRRGRGM